MIRAELLVNSILLLVGLSFLKLHLGQLVDISFTSVKRSFLILGMISSYLRKGSSFYYSPTLYLCMQCMGVQLLSFLYQQYTFFGILVAHLIFLVIQKNMNYDFFRSDRRKTAEL